MTKTSYTVNEAHRELGVQPNQVYQLIRGARLTAEKDVENNWRIDGASVEAYKIRREQRRRRQSN